MEDVVAKRNAEVLHKAAASLEKIQQWIEAQPGWTATISTDAPLLPFRPYVRTR